MKKTSFFMLTVVFVALALVGCGGDSGVSGDNEEKTLKYWSMWNTGEPQQEVIQGIIEDYEEENPNITIEVEWMGREVLSDVRNAIQSDSAPDITDQSGAEVSGTLIKSDMAEPMENIRDKEIPNEDTPLPEIYEDDVLDFYEEDGTIYYVPYEIITSGFHYNETLFEEKGIEPPTTWDEFIEVGETFKEEGMAPLAQDGNIDFYNAYYFYWFVERMLGNGALLEAAQDESGESWSTQPEFLEAAEKVQELADSDFFEEGYEGSQYPAAQTAWAKGDSAMILNGSWISSETNEYSSDDFIYRSFSFPELEEYDASEGEAELYLEGWVAPKGSDVEAVEDFIAFALQQEYQEGIADTGNLSPRHDVEPMDELVDFQEMIESADTYHPEYDGLQAETPEWWKSVFTPLDDKLVFGEITAKEFIEQLEKQSKEFYENQ